MKLSALLFSGVVAKKDCGRRAFVRLMAPVAE